MPNDSMLIYGILSGLTPALVLLNSVLVTAASSSSVLVQPLYPMALAERLTHTGPETWVTADKLMPEALAPKPQVRIWRTHDQAYLEFYNPFTIVEQTPDLMVMLDTTPTPDHQTLTSDRALQLGQLQRLAGRQHYAIPASVDVSQYRSVVIWCPEFNAIIGYAPVELGG